MQVLLTLILLYNIYFGCVIYEVFTFPKFYTVKTFAISAPEKDVILSITDLNNESQSNERSYYFDIYSRLCHHPIRFTANNSEQIKIKKLMQQCYCKNARRDSRLCFRTDTSRMHQRKLLGYERNFCVRPMRHRKFNGMHRDIIAATRSQLTERKHDIVARHIEPTDKNTDSEAWDNWSNWSTCSVTCGQGRQVRWRHCLSENCIKGLKKAQLKSCRLKDCGTKGFLGWLGIKS